MMDQRSACPTGLDAQSGPVWTVNRRKLMSSPPELTDRVLDFLHSDVAALSACTLVCREWLPSARFHLFSQIALDSSDMESFLDDMDVVGSPRPSAFSKFAVTGLGNVKSLRIDGLDLSAAPISFPKSLPHLESLGLHVFQADSFSIVATWLSALPSLRSLVLSGDWDGNETEMLTSSTSLSPTLPYLTHVDLDCPLRVLLGWFLSLAMVPAIVSLVLRDIWEEEVSTISRFLVAMDASLESLTLVYPRKDSSSWRR
ncbi:hypothetical protein DFH07DRAFT_103464 [Mycena maculata]|uniref:F-box domain-containing protein n=1 Tax=Mycena maculata TaxID=230809 RepID=A0AAD7NSZ4_9AGAR|nr:hypothetical protein DFH07DRAFT_103464 [Mycena maculata]